MRAQCTRCDCEHNITNRLGLMLGTRLWHSFADENDWESKISGLINELGGRGKAVLGSSTSSSSISAPLSVAGPPQPSAPPASLPPISRYLKSQNNLVHTSPTVFDVIADCFGIRESALPALPVHHAYNAKQWSIKQVGEWLRFVSFVAL